MDATQASVAGVTQEAPRADSPGAAVAWLQDVAADATQDDSPDAAAAEPPAVLREAPYEPEPGSPAERWGSREVGSDESHSEALASDVSSLDVLQAEHPAALQAVLWAALQDDSPAAPRDVLLAWACGSPRRVLQPADSQVLDYSPHPVKGPPAETPPHSSQAAAVRHEEAPRGLPTHSFAAHSSPDLPSATGPPTDRAFDRFSLGSGSGWAVPECRHVRH